MNKLIAKIIGFKDYFFTGVWREVRNTMKVRIIKTLSLSLQAFMDRSLQTQSMSLTYSTVLGIVPALALIFAIARGFGFQNLIEKELFMNFPAQQQTLKTAFKFVDSYLSEASQGIFVGVGLIVLLWTLVSLLSNVENVFNRIWDVKHDRTLYKKVTDYIAICLLVPVLMVCSAGISIFMSTMVDTASPLAVLSPVVDGILDISPLLLAWIAISLSYFLIPNTKVHFKYSVIGGAFAAIGFEVVQQLFVSGQIYVSKYNAIYGSFAFLPLLLIWLQLSWLILLSGCVLVHSMQNIFGYNYLGNVSNVSSNYMREITLAVMAIVVQRFDKGKPPITLNQISTKYNLPLSIISRIVNRLVEARLVYYVSLADDEKGLLPGVDNDKYTVGEFYHTIDSMGDKDFIPYFNTIFAKMLVFLGGGKDGCTTFPKAAVLIRDLPIPTPAEIKALISAPDVQPFPPSPEPSPDD